MNDLIGRPLSSLSGGRVEGNILCAAWLSIGESGGWSDENVSKAGREPG